MLDFDSPLDYVFPDDEYTNGSGVYVYSYPSHLNEAKINDTQTLLKVGMSTTNIKKRILAQARTAAAEDPVILRVYETNPADAKVLEAAMHDALKKINSHWRTKYNGTEWYRTSLAQLDGFSIFLQVPLHVYDPFTGLRMVNDEVEIEAEDLVISSELTTIGYGYFQEQNKHITITDNLGNETTGIGFSGGLKGSLGTYIRQLVGSPEGILAVQNAIARGENIPIWEKSGIISKAYRQLPNGLVTWNNFQHSNAHNYFDKLQKALPELEIKVRAKQTTLFDI